MSGRTALLLLVSACYAPPEPDCGFICGPSGACPTDYTCNSTDNRCHRNGSSPTLQCSGGSGVSFDVQSATAIDPTSVAVTFTAAPDPATATTLANYSIAGLTLSGTPMLAGSTVLVQTQAQAKMTYTVQVANVTRASDGKTLGTTSATFAGIPPFDVMSAQSTSAHSITVTFDAAPDPTLAANLANYNVSPALTLTGTPALAGSTVTIQTMAQTATAYTVTVSGVKRASDELPLTTSTAMFTGRAPFDVASAAFVPASTTSLTVTFDAAPDTATAQTAANYTIAGLTVTAAVLAGSIATLTTTTQASPSYMVAVSNVVRASDMEPLTTSGATFTTQCCDVAKDGDETDVDCGGATCTARCAATKMCLVTTDCQAGLTCPMGGGTCN